MAKRKRKRRSRKMTIPIAPVAGLIPMVAPSLISLSEGKYEQAVNRLAYNTVGIANAVTATPSFDAAKMVTNIAPLVAGLLVHKFVGGNLGVNRMLSNANVPFIRI